jgi:hypothetical protein
VKVSLPPPPLFSFLSLTRAFAFSLRVVDASFKPPLFLYTYSSCTKGKWGRWARWVLGQGTGNGCGGGWGFG